MKKLKKLMRLAGLVLLILLASTGIGIAGGFPLHRKHEQDQDNEVKTELREGTESVRNVE